MLAEINRWASPDKACGFYPHRKVAALTELINQMKGN